LVFGVGVLGFGVVPPTPKPQSPIPNPQSPLNKEIDKIKKNNKI